MKHEEHAAEARAIQRLIDRALERHEYEKIRELSVQLVERTRRACDSLRSAVPGNAASETAAPSVNHPD